MTLIHRPFRTSIVAVIFATSLALAGCAAVHETPSGGGAATYENATKTNHGIHLPVTDTTVIFNIDTCSLTDNSCYVYNAKNGNLEYTIGGAHVSNPQGNSVVDVGHGEQRLYIASEGTSNIPVYDIKPKSPPLYRGSLSISEPGQNPGDVAVVAKGDSPPSVLISNIMTKSGGSGSELYIDSTGNRTYLSDPSASPQGIGAALSANGDCYWSFNTGNHGQIDVFPGCKSAPQTVYAGLKSAGFLAFDHQGNLWFADQQAAVVYECPAASCSSPTRAFPNQTFVHPLGLKFDKNFKTLYIADYGAQMVFACTVGGNCVGAVKKGHAPRGVSVFPPAAP